MAARWSWPTGQRSVEHDLALGYVSTEIAQADYGLTDERIADVLAASGRGELLR